MFFRLQPWLISVGLVLFLSHVLIGCAGQPVNVIGHCEIPAALDYKAEGPVPPKAKKLKQHFVEDAKERAAHKQLVDDYNDLHDHIKDNCQ